MDLDLARRLVDQLRDALTPDAPLPAVITTADEFDAAYHTAAPGATILLDPSLVYNRGITIDKSINLVRLTGMSALSDPVPTFADGMTIVGPNVSVSDVAVRRTSPTTTIINMAGDRTTLTRVRALGDPVKGAKRGINYTGSNGVIDGCYVNDIFQPAQDTQAIYSDNMGPGTLIISNSYLCASGEVVMFGGGDAPAGRDPHDVRLIDCYLDKKTEWVKFDRPNHHTQQTKCSLELKNMRRFYSSGCTFRNGGGISEGQGGYAFDLTPRNQNGNNPTAAVQDVVIEQFTIVNPGSGIATITGHDDNHPSDKLSNVVLRSGRVVGVDHDALSATKTTGRLFTFNRAPDKVRIENISVNGANIRSICYFQGLQPPTGLVLGPITVDNGGAPIPYRFKLDGDTHPPDVIWPTDTLSALMAYMPDAQLDPSIR